MHQHNQKKRLESKMNNVQRKLLAASAAVILFCSVAFADGDMGGGGVACDPAVKTTECGDMGGGGFAAGASTSGIDLDWLLLTGRIIGLIG
jgi:hypothetical protein